MNNNSSIEIENETTVRYIYLNSIIFLISIFISIILLSSPYTSLIIVQTLVLLLPTLGFIYLIYFLKKKVITHIIITDKSLRLKHYIGKDEIIQIDNVKDIEIERNSITIMKKNDYSKEFHFTMNEVNNQKLSKYI